MTTHVPAIHPNGQLTPQALAWVTHHTGSAPTHTQPLEGGRNNRAFQLTFDPPKPNLLFKAYFRSDADPRDRLAHEFQFSEFAWKQGLRCLPQPLARDAELNAGLYAFLPGRMLTPPEVTEQHVNQAIDFFTQLNAHREHPDALKLPPGSEACFTNIDHVALVDQRIRQLNAITHPAAAAFLERELKPRWASIHPKIAKADDAFKPTPTCLSPSDFGFHNAILHTYPEQNNPQSPPTSAGLVFHDFEYAGQDDPAKLLGDFFHQPRVPAPRSTYRNFEDAVIETLQLDPSERTRFRTLLPVYRVKWCGIILAPLLPDAAERRQFAGIATDPHALIQRAAKLLHSPFPL